MSAKLAAALLVVAALAGCGSSSSSSTQAPAGSLSAELSYFPANTPLVLTLATKPGSPAITGYQALLGRFPEGALAIAALQSKLSSYGLDYATDIRPLFGNPLALGSDGGSISGAAAKQNVLIAWVTSSASTLAELIQKLTHGARAVSRDGAKVYGLGGEAVAVDGATLVFGSTGAVDGALARHAQGGGLSAAAYTAATSGLAQSSLVELYGNLPGLLSGNEAAKAPHTPVLNTLRDFGLSVSATGSGITVQYHFAMAGGPSLPAAEGSSPPNLAGTMPIQVGIRDPAALIKYYETAEQSADPSGYAKFLGEVAKATRKSGIDFNALIAQLTGDLILESDTHTTIARATVSSPSTVAAMLQKLASTPPGSLSKGTSIKRDGSNFYTVIKSHSGITVGVVGDQLLFGRATVAQMRSFAAVPTSPATGSNGYLAYRIDIPQLLETRLKQVSNPIIGAVLNSLGDLTGQNASSATGLSGSATLAIR